MSAAAPPSPTPKPMASEFVDDCEVFGDEVAVPLPTSVAIANGVPENFAVATIVGHGAWNLCSLMLQHFVFVRLMRSPGF